MDGKLLHTCIKERILKKKLNKEEIWSSFLDTNKVERKNKRMSKIKKFLCYKTFIIMMVLTMVSVMVLPIGKVTAKTRDSVVIDYKVIDSGFTITYDKMLIPQTQVIFISRDGSNYHVGFCVDPYTMLAGGQIYSEDMGFTGPVDSGIARMAYHGFYKQWGKNASIAAMQSNEAMRTDYMNTYALIYEEALGASNVKGLSINTSNYAAFKARVHSAMATHDLKPSFDRQTFEMYQGDTLTVRDTNGVFKDYEGSFPLTLNGVTYDRKGNDLILSTSDTAKDSIMNGATQKIHKWGSTSNINVVYRSLYSQSLFSGGYVDPLGLNLNVKIKIQGYAQIHKVNESDEFIKTEAIFGLYKASGEKIGIYKSDTTGKVTTSLLDAGDYYFLEERAPNGYLLNPAKHPFTIKNQKETVVVKVKDKEVLGRTTLKKQDAVSGGIPQGDATLVNAEYGLYRKDGTLIHKEVVGNDLSIMVNNLKLGDYYWQEVKASTGYSLDPTKHVFSLTYKDQYTPIVLSDTLSKEAVFMGNFDIVKLVGDGNSGVAKHEQGAVFHVQLISDIIKYGEDKAKVYDVLTTDEKGYAKSIDLPYGDYTITQIKAGNENLEPSGSWQFSVKEEQQKTISYEVVNQVHTAYLKVVKYDESSNEVIAYGNATFKIWDYQKKAYYHEQVGKDTIESWTTDEEGSFMSNRELPVGKYALEEMKAPSGYNKLAKRIDFEIRASNVQEVNTDHKPITIIRIGNQAPTGKIILHKMFEAQSFSDAYTAGFKISNGGTSIVNPASGAVIYKPFEQVLNPNTSDGLWYVNEAGELTIDHLPMGLGEVTYTAKEVVVSEQYGINEEILNFSFSKEGDLTSVYESKRELKNEVLRTDIEVVKTDMYTGDTIVGLEGFEISAYLDETCTELFDTQKVDVMTGKAVFKDIVYGTTLYFKESATHPDYYLSEEVIKVVVDKDLLGIGTIHSFSYDNTPKEKIDTKATVDNKKVISTSGVVTLEDEVTYFNLKPGVEVELKGILMDRKTGKPLSIDHKEVTSRVKFVPSEVNGIQKVTFKFDTSTLENVDIVVFEDLLVDGKVVATHHDIDDKDQMVHFLKPIEAGDTTKGHVFVSLLVLSAFVLASYIVIKKHQK